MDFGLDMRRAWFCSCLEGSVSVERGLSCSDKDGVLEFGDSGGFVGDSLDLQEIENLFLGGFRLGCGIV